MIEHQPTEQTRELVQTSSGLGLPHEMIGALLKIDPKTLRKHYREELDLGRAKTGSDIARTLYDKAMSGDVTSLIWWTKTQLRWSETVKQELTGADGVSLIPAKVQLEFLKPNDSQ
jgi:hypothetical protein